MTVVNLYAGDNSIHGTLEWSGPVRRVFPERRFYICFLFLPRNFFLLLRENKNPIVGYHHHVHCLESFMKRGWLTMGNKARVEADYNNDTWRQLCFHNRCMYCTLRTRFNFDTVNVYLSCMKIHLQCTLYGNNTCHLYIEREDHIRHTCPLQAKYIDIIYEKKNT